MNTEKTELCLEILSAVVWADAELSVEEVAHAVDMVDLANYTDRHRIEEIFMMPRYLPPASRLQMLSPEEQLRLFSHAQHLAREFKGVAPEEMEVLQVLHGLIRAQAEAQAPRSAA